MGSVGDQLDGTIALAVEIGGNRRFVGTVSEVKDSVCKFTVRGDVGLEKGSRLRIAFKTDQGQASVDAQVAVSTENKVVVVLTSPLKFYKQRSSTRKQVSRVTAVCQFSSFEALLHILDMSDTGFRYLSDVPLPVDSDCQVQFSFDGHIVDAVCKIVRQEEEEGHYTGGAKFCAKSRIEMAHLKRHIQFAA